jgi:hypothetical protein
MISAPPPKFRWGKHNPELMNEPFWHAMICSGLSAYRGARLVGGTSQPSPVWCAQRFGQSLTLLPDSRAIQIAGEHEDAHDEDFCIYNDVFVHHPGGRIDIYGYPETAFPPTDFHTATLIGDAICIIGCLGYPASRRVGETPVYRLDINTLEIQPVETTGHPPGWISRHCAALISPHEIRVWGGKLAGRETYEDNHASWILDVSRRQWRPDPAYL